MERLSLSARLTPVAAAALGLVVPLVVAGRAGLQAAAALALIGALVVGWSGIGPELARLRRHPLAITCAVTALAWVPSLIVSEKGGASAATWARTAGILLGAAALWAWLRHDARARAVAWKVLPWAALVLWTSFTLGLAVSGSYDGVFGEGRLKPAADVLTVAVPALALAAWRTSGATRAAALAAILVVPPFIVLSGGHSAAAGFATAATVAALAAALRRPRLLPIVALAAAAVVAAAVAFGARDGDGPLAHTPLGLVVDEHRQHIWAFAIEAWAQRPLAGWGVNAISRAPGASGVIPGVGGEYLPSHPHNAVLEVLAETGIVGVVPFLAAAALSILVPLVRFRRDGGAPDLAMACIAAGFWGPALFNFSFWSAWWLLSLFILYGMAAALRTETR